MYGHFKREKKTIYIHENKRHSSASLLGYLLNLKLNRPVLEIKYKIKIRFANLL